MCFTSIPGTYFWSNGSAWGTCTIKGNRAELKVLDGNVALKQFTINGIGTKKFKDQVPVNSKTLVIEI